MSSIRITTDQTLTITASFQNEDGATIEVTGNPDWYVITNHSSRFREPKLVEIFPDGIDVVVVPTGLAGTATIVACIYSDTPSPLDPESNRICNSVDVVIQSIPSFDIRFDKTVDVGGPGDLAGPVPTSLKGGITAQIGITIPPGQGFGPIA